MILKDITHCELVITGHAFRQADLRNIDAETIETTVKKGKMTRYGKHGVKFTSRGKRTLICVGELKGHRIKIYTVEEKQ